MKATAPILLAISLTFLFLQCKGQTSVEVSKPELSMQGKDVVISYHLLNSTASERFSVRIEITDSFGNPIEARTLSGDIGNGIPGGMNKKIVWDIQADSIFLVHEIFFEVYARPESPPAAIEPGKEETPAKIAEGKTFSRTSLMLQSLLLPGLGLSRLNPGKPHWIRGVVGYGCIGGAYYLNQKSIQSNEAYKNPTSVDEVIPTFNRAYRQDVVSEVLGIAAIGIWVSDLVWTFLATSDLNQVELSYVPKGVSLGTTCEPVSKIPLIALRYTF
jgi:hypothetical protein